MNLAVDAVLTVLGVAVVAAGLNDIFHTLLHPSGRGRISHWITVLIWGISRRTGHRLGRIAGPAAMVAVIVAWTLLQTLGWALIYYPHVPEGFSYSPGLDPGRYNSFSEAFYISLVTLATLGYGDVVPVNPWLRILSPVQGLTGFALLTAALSWFNQIYPALRRRRTLAVRLHHLKENRYADKLNEVRAVIGSRVLEELSAGITEARIDMTQNAETYYFRETDSRIALAASLRYALDLSDKARNCADRDIELNGRILQTALEDLAQTLGRQFGMAGDSTAEVLASYTRDHLAAGALEGSRRFNG
ncbi:potassium channel family protein [Arthrobacter sp. FW306-05-C]|uniref:potassium channel family protein n=1 Tax=Arthrobacter sp. FW306-05-C TaxID=2879620 RepID=UPI001F325210|nr:potassium channel family protein [Arthrobacter sp. FW306-05-C]UKA68426.1 potassium channel family protein [Arthrobacter sp. FW306-05-C]